MEVKNVMGKKREWEKSYLSPETHTIGTLISELDSNFPCPSSVY